MRPILIILASLFLFGCASNSGIVSVEPNTFIVTRQAATGFSGTGTLKTKALGEAREYCKQRGLTMKIVAITESQPPYVLGNFPKAEVVFKALPPGHPDLEQPTQFDPYHAQIKAGEKPAERIEATGDHSDVYDKLLKLDELRDKGILTEEEFQREKKKLLDQQ